MYVCVRTVVCVCVCVCACVRVCVRACVCVCVPAYANRLHYFNAQRTVTAAIVVILEDKRAA